MTLRPILLHPDPRLKTPCPVVPDMSQALRDLSADMLETMYKAPGIGLAAPQVGVLARLIVMDCVKDDDAPPRPVVMANPVIVAASDARSVYEEGCLSLPDHYADVDRPAEVTVRWIDLDGAEVEETFTGLWATCVQHEIDHLDGTLFIDHLSPLRRQLITRKMVKFKRDRARDKA
jgi:peptide deformylase